MQPRVAVHGREACPHCAASTWIKHTWVKARPLLSSLRTEGLLHDRPAWHKPPQSENSDKAAATTVPVMTAGSMTAYMTTMRAAWKRDRTSCRV